jgi:hypothetical protein
MLTGNAKVKFSLCLTKYHTMKTYGGVEIQTYTSLTLAMDRGKWSISCTSIFTPRGRSPWYPFDIQNQFGHVGRHYRIKHVNM